jgi:hypothetical protein
MMQIASIVDADLQSARFPAISIRRPSIIFG